jgi:hypothetical protein
MASEHTYEELRLLNIQRNNAILSALDIQTAPLIASKNAIKDLKRKKFER